MISNNTITGATTGGGSAIAVQVSGLGGSSSATVTGNTLRTTGSPSEVVAFFSDVNTVTTLPGSTGNVRLNGTCNTNGTIVGFARGALTATRRRWAGCSTAASRPPPATSPR